MQRSRQEEHQQNKKKREIKGCREVDKKQIERWKKWVESEENGENTSINVKSRRREIYVKVTLQPIKRLSKPAENRLHLSWEDEWSCDQATLCTIRTWPWKQQNQSNCIYSGVYILHVNRVIKAGSPHVTNTWCCVTPNRTEFYLMWRNARHIATQCKMRSYTTCET